MGDNLVSRAVNSPIPTVTKAPAKGALWAYDPAEDPDADLNYYSGPLDDDNDGLPYPCRVCQAVNKPVYKKQWYVVAKGLEVGVVFGLVSRTIYHFDYRINV
jgi:hypothetical protein